MIRTSPKEERRLNPRLFFRRNVTYEIPAFPGHRTELGGKTLHGTLLNISQGGVCLKTRYPLKKKTVLRLQIPINDLPVRAPTIALVVWLKKDKTGKGYRTGLQFIL